MHHSKGESLVFYFVYGIEFRRICVRSNVCVVISRIMFVLFF